MQHRDEVCDTVDTPDGATRLLDVGGGHRLYAIGLCRCHPDLSATVFDVPAALEAVIEEVAATDVSERVTLVGGDYETGDLGSDYDVALVFNVIHAHATAANRQLFEQVTAALALGGRIASRWVDRLGRALSRRGTPAGLQANQPLRLRPARVGWPGRLSPPSDRRTTTPHTGRIRMLGE